MKVNRFVLGLLLLMAPLVTAQNTQWQSMDGPYFVYDVTGVSLGWYGTQMRAYMVASDLSVTKIYRYQGTSPISGWAPGVEVAGAKHISASQYNAIQAYATVPQGAGVQPGVHYTTNGGQDWQYNVNAQPGDKEFTCIETHPTNPQICFTGGDNNASYYSSWYTTDGGERWDEIGPPEGIDPRYISNSVRIDPNSGSSWDNTTIYICYGRDQGIWRKFLGGDDNWERLVLFPDIESYNGIDVAVKEGNSNCVYLIAERREGDEEVYRLWHSDDGGIHWRDPGGDPGSFYNFGTDPVSKVIVYEYLENEVVWVISPNKIYIGVKFPDSHFEWASAAGSYQCIASDIGAPYPAGVVYAGLLNTIKQISGNWDLNHFDYFSDIDISKGTNIANIASLCCMIGSPLVALGKEGGYIYQNHQIVQPGDDDNWKTMDWLKGYQIDPNDGEVYGDKIISSYIDYDIGYTASGHDNVNPYLLEQGQLVDIGMEEPLLIKALAGPLIPNSGNTRPYAGGINTVSQNIVYEILYGGNDPDYLHTCDNFGSNPPLIEDMINDRSGGYTDYYICGERTSNQGNIVEYVDTWHDPHQFYPLNDGLDDISNAKAIIKSPEIYRSSTDFYPILYIGTEGGIFKTAFEDLVAIPWRNVSIGIGQGVEIIDLANYGQGIEYASHKPDSLVEYALGKDASGSPYLYVSADSGRSWIETGGYLRDQGLIASSITTISDIRTDYNNPYYLAVGTNRGIHTLPYNVKSGVLEQDETWGPGLVIINGDISIPQGVTLTIDAGTKVLMTYQFDRLGTIHDRIEITVMGGLILDGQLGDSVIITSSSPAPEPDDWFGIVVYPGGQLSTRVSRLDYARCGVIGSEQAKITITNSVISNCKEMGLFQKDVPEGTIDIRETNFKNCGTYAIQINGGQAILRSDTISGKVAYGIVYNGHHDVEITGCEVTTTEEKSYWGVSVAADSPYLRPRLLMVDDYVSGFTQGGFYLKSCDGHGPDIKNIWAYNSGVYGIYLVDSPVSIKGEDEDSRNSFCNDYYGIYCTKQSSGTFRWNNVKENRYCVFIDDSSNPNFGTRDNPGQNSFRRADNIYNSYEMYSESRSTIMANYNYWGSSSPRLYGRIDNDNPLERDPMPYLPKNSPLVPEISALSIANYPNPFNSNTEIKFNLAQAGEVSLMVYDIAGRLVKELANNTYDVGEHNVIWDGTNSNCEKVSSGIYFYSISTPEKAITKKMVFLK